MIALEKAPRGQRPLAVSTPGGAARQYRVQYQSADEGWRKYGSFRRRQQAEECLAELQTCSVRTWTPKETIPSDDAVFESADVVS